MSCALEVHSLASGSSGNAMLLKAEDTALLVDAGLPARTLSEALRRRGVVPGGLAAILLTHEHDDHMRGIAALSDRFGAPVVANSATLQATSARTPLGRLQGLETGAEARFGPCTVRSFPVSHDAVEPAGYVLTAFGRKVFYATDVGAPQAEVVEAMRGADLCILESNHDRDWLRRGPYPPLMKQRIASERGHLSNEEAALLVAQRLDADGPCTVWLAHLSKVNNSPSLALRHVQRRTAELTRVPSVIHVALRDRPSLLWRPGSAVQLSLFAS